MFCMYGVGLRTERAYSYTEPTSMDSFGQIDYRAHSGNWEFIEKMFSEMIKKHNKTRGLEVCDLYYCNMQMHCIADEWYFFK